MLLFVYTTTRKRFVIFTCRYFKLSRNTTSRSQSNDWNFSCSSIKEIMVHKTALGGPLWVEPPYPRIKLCRARKTDLSIFILRLLTSEMSLAESASFYLISFCHRISKKTIALSWLHIQSGEGRGEYSGFQVTGMIEWGQKSKPQKIPRASNKFQENPWTKISRWISEPK